MRTLVIYESMYGNTHTIAEAIAAGARLAGDATVVAVDHVRPDEVAAADLVVVGGPTHAHGMSRPSTRQGAVDALPTHPDLALDPDAEGPGVREWLGSLERTTGCAASFDTRVDIAPLLSGRASKGIGKALERHGFELVAGPESFLVTKETHLVDGEEDRARAWGEQLTAATAARTASAAHTTTTS